MFRVAIQVRELISSNVTSALDGASNPAKLLARLQREIEEALIGLAGEATKARRQHERLKAELVKTHARVDDWSDKARIAMDNGREDLARQALLAREDCRTGIDKLQQDIATLESEMTEMQEAELQLEAKRDDVRQRLADQLAADGNASGSTGQRGFASRTERRMDHIADLEKRTDFATQGSAAACSNAAVDREIEAMRRERQVEDELAAMREGAAPKKPAAKKPRKGSKAA